jgi:peroxiredoxin Q/BCP
MKEDFKEFTSRNASIVVIAPHYREKVEEYWKEENLPMIGIPDEDGKIADLFSQEWKLIKLGLMPALLVIDRNGSVAYARYGTGMSDIPANSEVLKVLDGQK